MRKEGYQKIQTDKKRERKEERKRLTERKKNNMKKKEGQIFETEKDSNLTLAYAKYSI